MFGSAVRESVTQNPSVFKCLAKAKRRGLSVCALVFMAGFLWGCSSGGGSDNGSSAAPSGVVDDQPGSDTADTSEQLVPIPGTDGNAGGTGGQLGGSSGSDSAVGTDGTTGTDGNTGADGATTGADGTADAGNTTGSGTSDQQLVVNLSTRFLSNDNFDYWNCINGLGESYAYLFSPPVDDGVQGEGVEINGNVNPVVTTNFLWQTNGPNAIFVTAIDVDQQDDVTNIQFDGSSRFIANSNLRGAFDCELLTVDNTAELQLGSLLPTRFDNADSFDFWACRNDNDELFGYRFSVLSQENNSGTGDLVVAGDENSGLRDFVWQISGVDQVALTYRDDGSSESLGAIEFVNAANFTTQSSVHGSLNCQLSLFTPPEVEAEVPGSETELASFVGTTFIAGGDFDFWVCTADNNNRFLYSFVVSELGRTSGSGALADVQRNDPATSFVWATNGEDALQLTYPESSTQEDLTTVRLIGNTTFSANSSVRGEINCEKRTAPVDLSADVMTSFSAQSSLISRERRGRAGAGRDLSALYSRLQ